MNNPIIEWSAPEHHHVEKTSDWYWAVGVIVVTGAALAFIFNNIIFGIFIIVAGAALMIRAAHKPHIIRYEINDRGIVVDNVLYPFLSLESFWIDAHEHPPRILIKSQKLLMPYLSIHIEEVDPEEVRQILLTYIAETEHVEPLSVKILERFGF